MATAFRALRGACRVLLHRRGWFSASALVMMAGIGLATAMFALTDPFLTRPLPYKAPDRLAFVQFDGRKLTRTTPVPVVDDLRASKAFEDVTAYRRSWIRLPIGNRAVDLTTMGVTERFLSVLGLSAGPAWAGGTTTNVPVILTHKGVEALGGTARTGDLLPAEGGRSLEIVGVLGDGFLFPDPAVSLDVHALVPLDRQTVVNVDAWRLDGTVGGRGASPLSIVGRLRPGVSAASAQIAVTRGLQGASADKLDVSVVPLVTHMTRDVRPLAGGAMAVGVLLLVVCAGNFGNLLLLRLAERRGEIATRVALGATRADIARLHLTELFLVTIVTVILGLQIAWLVLAAMRATIPSDYAVLGEPALTARVVIFACLAGVAVAAIAAMPSLAVHLRTSSGQAHASRATDPPGTRRLRIWFTGCQAAIAMILAIAAGVLIQSYLNLSRQDTGFDQHAVAAVVSYPLGANEATKRTGVQRSIDDLRRVPGVTAVGVTTAHVASNGMNRMGVLLNGVVFSADTKLVSPGFFEAAGLTVTQGRGLLEGDGSGAIVVTESFARTHWPGQSALDGVVIFENGRGAHARVVGIVKDVIDRALDEAASPTIFLLMRPEFFGTQRFTYVVRGTPGQRIEAAVERTLRTADPSAIVGDVAAIGTRLWNTVRPRVFAALILTLFGIASCLVTIGGVVGVVASAVARRTREIAVREALGATRRHLYGLVTRETMLAAAAGGIVGFLTGRWLSTFVGHLAYGLTPGHWGVAVAAASVLALTVSGAGVLAARRAMSRELALSLRAD